MKESYRQKFCFKCIIGSIIGTALLFLVFEFLFLKKGTTKEKLSPKFQIIREAQVKFDEAAKDAEIHISAYNTDASVENAYYAGISTAKVAKFKESKSYFETAIKLWEQKNLTKHSLYKETKKNLLLLETLLKNNDTTYTYTYKFKDSYLFKVKKVYRDDRLTLLERAAAGEIGCLMEMIYRELDKLNAN